MIQLTNELFIIITNIDWEKKLRILHLNDDIIESSEPLLSPS